MPELSPFTPASPAQIQQIQEIENSNNQEDQTVYYESPSDYAEVIQETDSDYLIQDPFEEDQARPGCFGWIKSWFKFV